MAKQESTGTEVQPAVHLVLQGKGGVGKSFVAAILAQYFKTKTAQVHCLDTDPVNATFAQYRILGAEHLNVLKRGAINDKRFDDLVEIVCRKAGIFVIDTGATTFVPLWNYFLENQIIGFLQQQGKRMFIHSIVSGGQAMSDTLNGLERIAETTTDRNVIVWLNEYFGEVTKDGKTFEEFKVAEAQAAKFLGTVVIRERNPNTYGDDVRQMLERRLTFGEAIELADFSLVSKQRLAIVRRELFQQIDDLCLI
jgi:hypothetical protein